MLPQLSVLFLCTGNSCRSQMAEAWARQLHGDRLQPYSAGTKPGQVDPRAIRVLNEAGVNISDQRSKHVDELQGRAFDWVVTVCDHANESCPVFPGAASRMHVAGASTEEEALAPYRRIRDELRAFVQGLPRRLDETRQP